MQTINGKTVTFDTTPDKCDEHYYETMYAPYYGYGSFCCYCGTEDDCEPTPEQMDAMMEQALDIMYPTPEPFERWT